MGILPKNYFIHLEPNMENFSFQAYTEIQLHSDKEVNRVDLDALELKIEKCEMEGNEINFEVSQEEQKLSLFLNRKVNGEFKVKITYEGQINDKLVGFYRSKYMDGDKEKYVAVTQFQENDARRAFPCFDTPGKKATFDIEFVTEENYICISNTAVIEEKKLGKGKKLVRFETTPIMSTYLVFFGVGEFEVLEGESRGRPVRLIASPGKAKMYGEFGLDFGIKSLEYCEDWFGVQYPISKLDLIGTPAFAHGAMENWGAILFRENLLLYYPGITSKLQELRIEEVIAHEIVHQWFGNLVSPTTWKYLWLNESFATFFSYLVVDHYRPEKRVWEFFIVAETSPALNSDARHATLSIEVPEDSGHGMTIKNVNILYNKGGSILRQMMVYLGEKEFQKGLRHYLEKYKFGVATSGDLWQSIQEKTGKPVVELMESWVLQEGYPVVSVKREGEEIVVKQRRFTFLPNDSKQTWLIPLSVTVINGKKAEHKKFTFDKKEDRFTIGSCDAFKVNTDATGFYRVRYEAEELKKLSGLVKDKTLNASDRWSIENDLFAFLKSGEIELNSYLEFLPSYENEDNAVPLRNIASHLSFLHELYDDKRKGDVARQGISLLESILGNIGYEPREDEDPAISMARPDIIWTAVQLGSEKAGSRAMEWFEMLKAGKDISPDLRAVVLRIGAMKTNDWEWFIGKFNSAQNEQELVDYGNAITRFTDDKLIDKVEEFIFESIPYRNRGGAIAMFCANPNAKDRIWKWYLSNLDNFEKLHPFMYQIALVSVISNSEQVENDMRDFFEGYVKKNPMVADAVEVGFETLQISKQIKSR